MKLSISMTRRETLIGRCYLLISMFGLPFAFGFINSLLATPLSESAINLLYFGLNFLCVALIFHRFLGASVKAAAAAPWRCLRSALLGFFLYYLMINLLGSLTAWAFPDFTNANDESITQLAQEHSALWAFATIWLVPITEEVLHRGLIFQGLQRKNRLLAYSASTIIFALIHILGYVGLQDWLTLLISFVQYLPAGIVLAWSYEQADTIIAPILIHITINQIGIAALR